MTYPAADHQDGARTAQAVETEALKACPFCGSENIRAAIDSACWAECKDCFAYGPSSLGYGKTGICPLPNTANDRWNRRAISTPVVPDTKAAQVGKGVDTSDLSAFVGCTPEECRDCYKLRETMADLLTRTVNALRGEPKPLHVHSWHNIPKLAASLIAEKDRLRDLCGELVNTFRIHKTLDRASISIPGNIDGVIELLNRARAALSPPTL